MPRRSVFTIVPLAVLGTTALAQTNQSTPATPDKPLTVGDPVQPIEVAHLDIAHWLKGEPVTQFEPGKVYVLEFWATWCGPCRTSMPHISELQTQFKDYGVTFIGISDEDLPTVVKFLCTADKEGKVWNDKIQYTLATDPDESVKNAYFRAAGQNGIPCAFIVGKDAHVEWIGHPMSIEKPLEAVVKDSWDRDAFKAKWEKDNQAQRESAKVQSELRAAIKAKDWPKALEILDAQIAQDEEAVGPQMNKFTLMLSQMDEPAKAYELGEAMAKQNWDDAQLLNAIAWFVVDEPNIKKRDLEFAHKLASRANELTDEKNTAILDTLARVHYEKGDLKDAVRIQKKAVEHSAAGPMADEITASLKKYEDELAKKND